MIQRKICLLGAFAVGKTSLVRQFVQSQFSEKYITTVGVQISQKLIAVGAQEINLLIWDTIGEDDYNKQRYDYMRGSTGIIFVADGTRLYTLETVPKIYHRVIELLGHIPFVFLINKADLIGEWKLNDKFVEGLLSKGWPVTVTSAKTGAGVEEAFVSLAKMIIERI